MSLKPDKRYESAQEFGEQLEDYLSTSAGRVSSKEVAALITEAFQEDRTKVAKLIEDHVAAMKSGDTKATAILELTLPSSGSGGTPGSGAAPSSGITPPGSSTDAEPPLIDTDHTRLSEEIGRRRRRPVVLVAGVLAVGLVVALVALRGPSEEPAATPTPPPTPQIGQAESADEASAQVAVKVSFSPDSAKVTLDGAAMRGNPAMLRVAKDDSTHRLSVSAEGHETHEEWISLASNVELEIQLKPTKAAEADEPAKPTAIRRPGGPRRPPSPPPPEAASPPPPPPPPDGARSIDKDNPY